jgi:putative membrane protein
MHVGKAYKAHEFLAWSRRKVFVLLIVGLAPVAVHAGLGVNVGIIPWSVILLLGTTVALVAGFKNTQIYNRTVEAQQIWSAIATTSRLLGILCADFLNSEVASRLIHRHIAWLTVMRFELRSPRVWETASQKANAEYRRRFRVLEQETSLHDELRKCVSPVETAGILNASNPAAHVLNRQGTELKALLDGGSLSIQAYLEMLKVLRDLFDQQARCERIKNFPYPRQYAVVSALFVGIFCVLLPIGLVSQFEQLEGEIDGVLKGHLVWLAVPFSVIIGWMYAALDQVGESTANPFEGGANDVPISRISRAIEVELRELLGERELPPQLEPVNGIAT